MSLDQIETVQNVSAGSGEDQAETMSAINPAGTTMGPQVGRVPAPVPLVDDRGARHLTKAVLVDGSVLSSGGASTPTPTIAARVLLAAGHIRGNVDRQTGTSCAMAA